MDALSHLKPYLPDAAVFRGLYAGSSSGFIALNVRESAEDNKNSMPGLACIFRAIMNYKAVTFIDRTWNAVRLTPLPQSLPLKVAAAAFPIVLGTILYNGVTSLPPLARRILAGIHHHADTLAMGATAVSFIALAAFSNPLAGGVGLACIGATLICEQQLIGLKGRVAIRRALLLNQIALAFTLMSTGVGCAFMVLLAATEIARRYQEHEMRQLANRPKPLVSAAEAEAQQNNEVDLDYCREVFLIKQQPREDFDFIQTESSINKGLIHRIDWNNWDTVSYLYQTLENNDAYWVTVMEGRLTGDREYIEEGLRKLASRISREQIPSNEPNDYGQLRTLVSYIARNILDMPNGPELSKAIIRLAHIGHQDNGSTVLANLTFERLQLRLDHPSLFGSLQEKVQAYLLRLRHLLFAQLASEYKLLNSAPSRVTAEDLWTSLENELPETIQAVDRGLYCLLKHLEERKSDPYLNLLADKTLKLYLTQPPGSTERTRMLNELATLGTLLDDTESPEAQEHILADTLARQWKLLSCGQCAPFDAESVMEQCMAIWSGPAISQETDNTPLSTQFGIPVTASAPILNNSIDLLQHVYSTDKILDSIEAVVVQNADPELNVQFRAATVAWTQRNEPDLRLDRKQMLAVLLTEMGVLKKTVASAPPPAV